MIRAVPLILAALLLNVAPSPLPAKPQPSATVQPGRWEYRYRLFLFPAGSEFWCLRPQQIERAFAGPCNRHHTCSYPVREVTDGRLRLEGTWTDKHGRVAPVFGRGAYTPTTIRLSVDGRTVQGLPFRGSMTAKRVGDACLPGDKS